jgi:FixJ family two-component response regulator
MLRLDPYTVVIVDDDAPLRAQLAGLLSFSGFKVESYGAAEALLSSDVWSRAGCLVLDFQLPGLDGLALQDLLGQQRGSLPIVFVSGHADVAKSVRAMKHGAVDFLVKPVDADDLLRAIEQALERRTRALRDEAEETELRRRYASLTPRERDVFALVVAGRLNKQVARELGIAEKTVKVHRARVMEKMVARSLAQLVRFAVRMPPGTAPQAA